MNFKNIRVQILYIFIFLPSLTHRCLGDLKGAIKLKATVKMN